MIGLQIPNVANFNTAKGEQGFAWGNARTSSMTMPLGGPMFNGVPRFHPPQSPLLQSNGSFGSRIVPFQQTHPYSQQHASNAQGEIDNAAASMFVSAVLNPRVGFTQSYSILEGCCSIPGFAPSMPSPTDFFSVQPDGLAAPGTFCRKLFVTPPSSPRLTHVSRSQVSSAISGSRTSSRQRISSQHHLGVSHRNVEDDDEDEMALIDDERNMTPSKKPRRLACEVPIRDSPRHAKSQPEEQRSLTSGQAMTKSPQQRRVDSRSSLVSTTKSPRQTKHGLGGERRLNIQFLHTGKHVQPPQTFGKYGLVVPDGICGTHTMYAQSWTMRITHEQVKGTVVLRWSVTNNASGSELAVTETVEQAFQRQTKGNTICNIVVREALNRRAIELDEEIAMQERAGNVTRVANLRSLSKELKPKQCTEGLLFFGLRHEAVQSGRTVRPPRQQQLD